MKKLLALLLCLSMVLGTTAYAAETELNKDLLEGKTSVSLTIAPEANEFVVTIPASVVVDPETQEGTMEIVLKSGWKLVSANGLQVKIKEFANGINYGSLTGNYYCLTLADENGNEALYSISLKADGDQYWHPLDDDTVQHTCLIDVNKGYDNTTDRSALLKLNVKTLPTEPGEYKDIITFAVTLN